jgi:hypothetical protein
MERSADNDQSVNDFAARLLFDSLKSNVRRMLP